MFRLFYQPGNQDDCHSQRSQITDDEEDDNQQASHGQQNVGGEEIEEIVKRESIDLQWRVTPNVNAAGKMTKPARTATRVSDIITEKAVLVKLSSSEKKPCPMAPMSVSPVIFEKSGWNLLFRSFFENNFHSKRIFSVFLRP
jgi:hypothetical protein